MDPFSLILLSATVLGAAMASSEAEAQAQESVEHSLWDVFRLFPWHFAMSYDWEPFTVTVRAGDLKEAEARMEHHLEEEEDGHIDDYRTYAVIRGGEQLFDTPGLQIPAGAIVHIVWQAERSIDVISVTTPYPMTFDEVLELAWNDVSYHSDVRGYARESGMASDAPIQPNLVVVGGTVHFKGSLR